MTSFRDVPSPPMGASLPELLKLCMIYGFRPAGSYKDGEAPIPWEEKTLADALKITDRQLRNYLSGESRPVNAGSMERVFFGEDQSYCAEWRDALRTGLKRARLEMKAKGKTELESFTSPIERFASMVTTEPENATPVVDRSRILVGATLIAIGVVHLAWLASNLFTDPLIQSFQAPWNYGDAVFGFGGVVVGCDTMRGTPWSRFNGTWFTILGLLCSYLWFMDDTNWTAARDVIAMNVLSAVLAVYGTWFFLWGWPKHDLTSATRGV